MFHADRRSVGGTPMPFFWGIFSILEQWLNLGELLVWADGCFGANHALVVGEMTFFSVA